MSNADEQVAVDMTWDGGPFHGMQVVATVTSMAATIAAEDFVRRVASGKPLRGKHVHAVSTVFLDHVRRWNITGLDGRIVRPVMRDFLLLHKDRVMAVLSQWVAYVSAEPQTSTPAPAAAPVPEPETPSEPDLGALLEARTLQEPGPDEQLVESVPELVKA